MWKDRQFVFWSFGRLVVWLTIKSNCQGLAKGGEMVFWCFGVFVFWLKFKSQVKGLAKGGEMVFWCFGVFVFWLKFKSQVKGLAEGGEVVFWCFGVFVFWLKFKSQVNGLAFGFVRLVVWSFGRLVFSLNTVIFPVPVYEVLYSLLNRYRGAVVDCVFQALHGSLRRGDVARL